jgi:UDP-N-acetylmuramate--alanine ligase
MIIMLGIAGTGMRGLGFILHAQGQEIIGVDDDVVDDGTLTFAKMVMASEAAGYVAKAERLIYSDAVKEDHPLRQAAVVAGILQDSYQAALGKLTAPFTLLAVTGTHGKSSTTGMLAAVLEKADFDPTALVGAPVPAWENRNALFGDSEYFVIEADEYREHFLTLQPKHIIITSIDFDHPDFFKSLADVEMAYSKFIAKVPADGSVVVLKSVHEAHPHVTWPTDERLVIVDDKETEGIILQLAGEHMRRNAALVLALARRLGIDETVARQGLAAFVGLGRRMEWLGKVSDMELYSDYGHHPAEIAATLQGAREKFADQKIVAVFEAHMIERLETFTENFAQALAMADGVIICPVFMPKGRSGEQTPAKKILAETLRGMKNDEFKHQVFELGSYDELSAALTAAAMQYDVAIGFTAGVLDGKLRTILHPRGVNPTPGVTHPVLD